MGTEWVPILAVIAGVVASELLWRFVIDRDDG